ncbi:hypothetical protein VCR31J2_780001 [Vibrio coralliirubri]|uniref:Uncharacterized protein n=1 Tax=Vibrio coralliirubri TaxID=1516159 RepID=A0AA86XUW2_9VIBR|nr:hypothetical protein VCR31J2_780001 [Vibrio coralliirubri]
MDKNVIISSFPKLEIIELFVVRQTWQVEQHDYMYATYSSHV